MRERLRNMDQSQRKSSPARQPDIFDDRLLLRVEEAARRLSLSRSAMWSLVSSGSVPSIHVGRARRIVAADLEAWVTKRGLEGRPPASD